LPGFLPQLAGKKPLVVQWRRRLFGVSRPLQALTNDGSIRSVVGTREVSLKNARTQGLPR